MTLASLFVALILTSAADAPGEPVLLDFTATWCGPCQTMNPVVEKLVRNNYPVRQVDIDRSPDVAHRYGVKAVPTFIVVDARGRALSKTSGVMTATQLASFYNEAKAKLFPNAGPTEARDDQGAGEAATPQAAEPEPDGPAPLVNPKPWETVVRIKMHLSSSEWGFGSGTIIHSSPEESIILTCAHIFKVKGMRQPGPKEYRVPISIDLFDGQITSRHPAMVQCIEKDIPGEAIDFDLTNDVGLIRIRPGRVLPASRVVPPDWQPRRGMKMYAVGCSHGNDATAWDTTILDPRVPMGLPGTKQSFASMKCANEPKQGRSGGGLYTTDGYVAGVCDFADPNEQVGLYAVPDAIHHMLDRNRLMALYRRDAGGEKADRLLANNPPRPRPSAKTIVRGQNDSDPNDLTIPRPEMIGIETPKVVSKATNRPMPWQASTGPAAARRTVRPPDQVAKNEVIDAGAPTPNGEAITTDLGAEPGPDARAFDAFDARPPAKIDLEPPVIRPTTPTKWRPVRQALPEPAPR